MRVEETTLGSLLTLDVGLTLGLRVNLAEIDVAVLGGPLVGHAGLHLV